MAEFGIGESAKLYPDQRGNFHHLTKLYDGTDLPKLLKDASWELSKRRTDVRLQLIDLRCKKALGGRKLRKFPVKDVCLDVDNYVKAIHEDLSQHSNRIFRKYITYIHAEWIEKREDAETLFPYFATHKQAIVCAIILDKQRLDLLTHFADWEQQDIEEIIAQPNTVTILKGRCQLLETQVAEFQRRQERLEQEQHLLARLNRMEETKICALLEAADPIGSLLNEQQVLMEDVRKLREEKAALQHQSVSDSKSDGQWSRAAIAMRIGQQSRVHEEVVSHVSEVFSSFLPDSFDFHRLSSYIECECDLTAIREVGFLGEAAVFRDLRDSKRFFKVTWPNQTNQSGCPTIISGGEPFHVNEMGHPYDIEAITVHQIRILIEVKSTVYDIADRNVGHHFGRAQLELFGQSPRQHQSVLALVFNARNPHPVIRYFSIGELAEMKTDFSIPLSQ
jgi:hypothetical protein